MRAAGIVGSDRDRKRGDWVDTDALCQRFRDGARAYDSCMYIGQALLDGVFELASRHCTFGPMGVLKLLPRRCRFGMLVGARTR